MGQYPFLKTSILNSLKEQGNKLFLKGRYTLYFKRILHFIFKRGQYPFLENNILNILK